MNLTGGNTQSSTSPFDGDSMSPSITVGIVASPTLTFEIKGYDIPDGTYTAVLTPDGIMMNGTIFRELMFNNRSRHSRFTLHDVTIGIQFHWERKESQTFMGKLRIIANGDTLQAINTLSIEDYLTSVISSEMNANASLEFLKAHAVISRSWAYSRILSESHHTLFDVCADDHCQRYQGIGHITNQNALKAISETCGEVLTYNGEICDTRYSKCCGGKTELFSTCWEDTDMPYLICKDDPYCDTHDSDVLSQVLNSYDLETKDFHDWEVHYTNEELTALLRQHITNFEGNDPQLLPLEYGPSGRIKSLKVITSKGEYVIGKELAIRRALSPTHLKSSAFTVETTSDGITLHGHGWGHGVGLCQIGAAVMGSKGFNYKEILDFYYPGTKILTINPNQSEMSVL